MQTSVTSDRAKMEEYNTTVKQTSQIKSSTNVNADVENVDLNYTSSSNESPDVEVIDFEDNSDTGIIPITTVNDPSVKEELEGIKESIDTKVDELSKEVAELQDEYDTLLVLIQNPVPFMQEQNDENLRKAQEIEEKLNPLKEELMTMEALKKQVDHSIELAPYIDLTETDDYIDFVTDYDCDYQGLDYELLSFCDYDITMYIGQLTKKYTPEELKKMHANEIDELAIIEHILKNKPDNIDNDTAIGTYPCLSEIYEKYKYMTEDEIMMYHYLYKTGGQEKAEEYLNLIEDDINQAIGAAKALDFINSLDLTDEGKLEDSLKNLFGVSGKGLTDGIGTFFDGIANVFQNNDQLTAEDYEKMIILSYLSENSVYHDEIYEFSSALGNMVPAMVASAVVTLVATPAGGATVAGISFTAAQAGAVTASTLMGLSAMGNAKHQALVNGSDVLSSTLYGMFVGLSEATLGYFLGNIPGISQTAGFTLRGLLQEGAEEFLQEWVDAGLQAVILGEDVDWSTVPESATKSFFMGVLMSGFLNGGQQVVNVMVNGVNVEVNVEEVLEYMNENNETDVLVAMEALEPGILDLLFRRNNTQQNSSLTNQDIQNQLASLSHNNNAFIPDAIESLLNTYSSNGRDNAVLRQICRVSIEYMKAHGYTAKASANIISSLYYNILNNNGFTTYQDPDTGIKISVLNGINWANQSYDVNTVLNQIKSLPPECQSLIKELNFYDTFNPADFYWELEYNTHDFHSAATGGYGQINFWDTNIYSPSTVIHEMGHIADTEWASSWGVSTDRISESQLWIDAMQADLATSGVSGVTEYARNAYDASGTLHEDFAEAVAMFYNNPNALDAFPARKALLMQYLPQVETMATTYDKVYDILVNKYGQAEAEQRLKNYYETGNINQITRDGGARDMLSRYSLDEYKQYIDQLEAIKINDKYNAVESSLLLCFNALVDKYGYDQAVLQLQEFINTGDKTYITNNMQARDSIIYSVEDYREVMRLINNGSLSVKYLFPKQ